MTMLAKNADGTVFVYQINEANQPLKLLIVNNEESQFHIYLR